jgi:DNA-binding NtrC family response regulator
VRELENVIEHAVLVSQSDTVTWSDIPASLKERIDEEQHRGSSLSLHVEELNRNQGESARKLFREALAQAGGDVVIAANKLGMSRATFYRRLKKYGLTGQFSDLRHSITRDT